MNSADHMRLDVLAAAVQEIARALAPAQAAAVADALLGRVATMTAGALSEVQDEAAMGELVPLLSALGRPTPMWRWTMAAAAEPVKVPRQQAPG